MALAPLLPGDIRDIRLLHLLPGNGPLQVVSDHKARPVRVRQQDQPPLFRQPPQKRQLFPIVEHGEPAGLHHRGVHRLQKGVAVIPPLHHDDLFYPGLHLRPANSIRNSFNSSSFCLSGILMLFIRRSSCWHRSTAVRHQSWSTFLAACISNLAG